MFLAACPSAAADHTRLGDEAMLQGDYPTAVAEYRAGIQTTPRPELYARLGAAALHLRNYREAVDAYRTLAEVEPSRVGEAAAGLERAARGAQAASDLVAMRSALLALQAVAPERPAGRLAVSLALSGRLEPAEAIRLMPSALAGASTDRQVDSLLLLYANAQRETTACEEAVRIYRVLVRRAGDESPSDAVTRGLAGCALRLGLDATALDQPEIAERWFRLAVVTDSTSTTGYQALLGLGESRLEQGDSLQAAALFRRVADEPAATDSVREVATTHLAQMLPGGGTVLPMMQEP